MVGMILLDCNPAMLRKYLFSSRLLFADKSMAFVPFLFLASANAQVHRVLKFNVLLLDFNPPNP